MKDNFHINYNIFMIVTNELYYKRLIFFRISMKWIILFLGIYMYFFYKIKNPKKKLINLYIKKLIFNSNNIIKKYS